MFHEYMHYEDAVNVMHYQINHFSLQIHIYLSKKLIF